MQTLRKLLTCPGSFNGLFSFYVLSLFAAIAYYFFNSPISADDTDLWYHLNGGRYIFENKSIDSNSFFSFLTPLRERVDYSWLFRVLVYELYSYFDYYGLIFLRAVAYLATISIVLKYLIEGFKNRNDRFFIFAIFALYLTILAPRYLLVRPHIFSFFFIALFLYILEYSPGKVKFLPLLAILWSNLHGITYPVIVLICLSYLIEFYFIKIKNRTPANKEDRFYIASIIFSLLAILFTPSGINLIEIPFIPIGYASSYIGEFKHITFDEITTFRFLLMFVPDFGTIFNLAFFAIILSAAILIIKKRMRLNHFLMFAGGLYLLTKGSRFKYEFILLSLPIMKSFSLWIYHSFYKETSKKVIIFSTFIFLIAMLFLLGVFFQLVQARYPLSSNKLPVGVATFLNRVNVGGRVLNHPNNGGYLQWALSSQYKIAMDMQVPHLFSDEDFFFVSNAYSHKETFKKFVSRYSPSFITVFLSNKKFKELVKSHTDYKLIFFDDSEALYVNEEHYPGIAKKYALNVSDPFTIAEKIDVSQLSEEGAQDLLKELLVLYGIYPEGSFVNQLIAMIYIKKGDYGKAMHHADLATKTFPGGPRGYWIKGDALVKQNLFDEALSSYETALRTSNSMERPEIFKKISACYAKLKQYDQAYYYLHKAINIFSHKTHYEDLYRLGLFAQTLNKHDEASMLFMFSYLKSPEEDEKVRRALKINLKNYGITDLDR